MGVRMFPEYANGRCSCGEAPAQVGARSGDPETFPHAAWRGLPFPALARINESWHDAALLRRRIARLLIPVLPGMLLLWTAVPAMPQTAAQGAAILERLDRLEKQNRDLQNEIRSLRELLDQSRTIENSGEKSESKPEPG